MTTESPSVQEETNVLIPERSETEASEKSSEWLTYAIQAVCVFGAILLCLTIYHFTIAEKNAQRIALLDINEVVSTKQLAITELSLRKGVTDRDREDLYDQITSFSKEIEKAVEDIQAECGCTLLVRSAVVKAANGEDLTPVLKAKLGLDKSIADLTKMIQGRSQPSAPLAPGSEPKFDFNQGQ